MSRYSTVLPPVTLNDLLADLVLAFPRQTGAREAIPIYRRELADLPLDELAVVVTEIIRGSSFFPTVAEIRKAVAARLLALPSETEAISQVTDRIEWARHAEGDEQRPDIHPLVSEALTVVGGFYGWRNATNPGIARAQFSKAYRGLCETAVHRLQVEGGLLLLTPALRGLPAA